MASGQDERLLDDDPQKPVMHDGDDVLLDDTVPIVTKENQQVPPGARFRYYSLPRFRYRNIAECVVFLDAITSLVLWLLGMYNFFILYNYVRRYSKVKSLTACTGQFTNTYSNLNLANFLS